MIVCDPATADPPGDFRGGGAGVGLETVDADFPGHPDMRLLQATRVELTAGREGEGD